jgi:O-antigen ligase
MGILAYGIYRLNFDLVKSKQNREVVVAAVCIIIFWLWLTSGLGIAYARDSYTTSGFEKFRNYTVLLVLPSFTLLFLIKRRVEEKSLLFNLALVWLFLIIITNVVFFFILLEGNYDLRVLFTNRLNSPDFLELAGIDRSKYFFSNPIWIARQVSYCLLIFASVSLWHPFHKRILSLLFFVAGVSLMLWAGSRGPIIGFFCGLTYLAAKRGLKGATKQIIVLAVIGIILISSIVAITGNAYNVQLIYKSIKMFDVNSKDPAINPRLKLYKNVITYKGYSAANIYGMGLGSYSLYSGKINAFEVNHKKPHNIFLEIYFELGWIGIVLFTCVFVVLPIYLYRASPCKTGFVIVSAAIYICVFINSMFSGDLKGNEMLPKMLMLLAVAVVNSKDSALVDQGKH